MSKNTNDIPNESVGDSKLPLHDFDDAYVDVPERDLDSFVHTKTSFWKDRPLGRTLSLRNKTGKAIAGVLATGIGFFTGVDITPFIEPLTGGEEMDFLADAGLIEIGITIVTFIVVAGVSWLGAYFKLPKSFQKKITQFIEVAATELEKAVDEESERGRKITRNEIKNGLYATFNKVFKSEPENLDNTKTE